MDVATVILARPSIARICIKMDLLKIFPSWIWIGCKNKGFWQKVIYKKIPKYCLTCLKQGHDHKKCKIKVNPREDIAEFPSKNNQHNSEDIDGKTKNIVVDKSKQAKIWIENDRGGMKNGEDVSLNIAGGSTTVSLVGKEDEERTKFECEIIEEENTTYLIFALEK